MKLLYIILGIAVIAGIALMFIDQSDSNKAAIPVNPNPVTEEQQSSSETVQIESEADTAADLDVVVDLETVKSFTIDSFGFGYSESEIRVKKGDTVTINLTNSDGFHDWVVDEFDAATPKIRAGETSSVTFVADKVGTFEYYCSVGSHRAQGMVGNLIVE